VKNIMTDTDIRIQNAEKRIEELRKMQKELLGADKQFARARVPMRSFFLGISSLVMFALGGWKLVELAIELIKYFRG